LIIDPADWQLGEGGSEEGEDCHDRAEEGEDDKQIDHLVDAPASIFLKRAIQASASA